MAAESGAVSVMSFEKYTHVFTVRLWRERREGEREKPIWRGSVQHLQSGERKYFRRFAGLLSFIAGKSGAETMMGNEPTGTGPASTEANAAEKAGKVEE